MSDFLSSFGPLILGIGLGLVTGGLGWGFAVGLFVGSMAGSLLFKPDTPTIEGPSLQDRKVQKSEYGAHLPAIWGRMRTTGNIAWVKGNMLDERIRRISQGGQKIKMRYYYATFLVLLADCDGGPIDGIEKIWLDNELVWDFSEQEVFDPASGETSFKVAATKMPGISFRVLKGDQTTADDLIEADLGVGNVPAYTGRAGVLFVDLPLEKYGNRIPRVECLVVRKSSGVYPATEDLEESVVTGEGSYSALDVKTGYVWKITDAVRPCEVSVIDPASGSTVATVSLGLVEQPIYDGEEVLGIGIDHVSGTAVVICYPGWEGTVGTIRIDIDLQTYQIVDRTIHQAAVPSFHPILHRKSGFYSQGKQTVFAVGGTTTSGFISELSKLGSLIGDQPADIVASGGTEFLYAQELARWQDFSGKIYPYPVWLGEPDGDVPLEMDAMTGTLVAVSSVNYLRVFNRDLWMHVFSFRADEWTNQGAPRFVWDYTRHFLYSYDPQNVGAYFYRVDLNPSVPVAEKITLDHNCAGLGYDAESDTLIVGSTTGVYVYRASDVTLITSRSGVNASGDLYAPANAAGWFVKRLTMEKIYYDQQFIGDPALSTVVGEVLSTISDFTEGDYDLTALTQPVKGYASGPTVRGSIEPLRQLYRFDLVEVDHQLKAINRGAAPVAVIEWEDLGASADSKPVSAVTVTRRQEVELAKSMTLTYLDQALDYQNGTQRGNKIQTRSDHHVDISLPIVMTADEAAQAVEILLHQDWLARTGYAAQLPPKYAYLAPADVISIPMDEGGGEHYTMLIGEQGISPELLVSLKGVREQSDIYTSSATGAAGTYTPQVVLVPYPSRLELLDINPFVPVSGFFAAVSPTRYPWPGADVLESASITGPYDAVAVTREASVIGSAVTVLADAKPWRVDDANSVTVRLADPSATLTSGLALLGDEIIHFSSAVQNGQQWTLSMLMRGRKGTDTHTGTHVAGERFVLLDDKVLAISQNVSEKDVPHYFKPVTRGEREETVAPRAFANGFNCLKPWSPKQAAATIGSDTVLVWQRSDRLATIWHLSVELPLSESSEAYEVDILDGAGEVIRTATGVTAATWTYTAAMKSADSDAGETAKIYQISATVGRGYPATVAI